ncbi:signal peptidase I [Chloroflexota bacterium]
MRVFIRDILGTAIGAIAIFLILQASLQSSIIIGSSMEPNFEDGQRLLISKVVYYFREPARGDVVVFTPPHIQDDEFIKRIIGLPGESVEIKENTVYIYHDDEVLSLVEQAYIEDPPRYTFSSQTIPASNYFVLGDNRNNSNDSHHGWTVTSEDIVGTAWLSIWPPDKWGLVPNHSPQEQPES